MPIIEWGSRFKLGIEPFDEHHRHLVGLLNRSYDEYTRDASSTCTEEIITELISYTDYHFAAEESWMLERSFPKFQEHKAEHDAFAEKIAGFRHKGLSKLTATELFFLLSEWLTTHIQKVDAEYLLFTDNKR